MRGMPGFDGLSVLEDLLGMTRVQGCKPPHVPRAQPGPCPLHRFRPGSKLRRGRKRIAEAKAVAKGKPPGYSGPSFPVKDPGKWNSAVGDAVTAAIYGKGEAPAAEREAARERADTFRAGLDGAGKRRFDQLRDIGVTHAQWRGPEEPAAASQAKMTAALKELWDGKPVAVRVTTDALENILRTGRFKTVHETYRSGGSNNPAKRGELEEQLFGIDPKTSPKETRPVYGYVAVNGIRWQKRDSALGQYGNVQVVLKDQVRERTTASNGNSMGHRGSVMPSPVNDPQYWSWATRGQQQGQYSVDPEELAQRSYAEAQIHGGVDVGDIEEVVFAREPEDRVKRRLEEKGIPWRIVQD